VCLLQPNSCIEPRLCSIQEKKTICELRIEDQPTSARVKRQQQLQPVVARLMMHNVLFNSIAATRVQRMAEFGCTALLCCASAAQAPS
jgi:hypothetical protein